MKNPFGNRYDDAHLSKVEQSESDIEKINYWWKNPSGTLYMCGNAGTGKTYICAAFYNQFGWDKCRAYRECDLLAHLRETINKNWDAITEIKRLCQIEYMILDDLGSSSMTDWQKEMLFCFIDERYNNKLPTIITSNLDTKQMKNTFHNRMFSRLYAKENVVIDLLNSDDRRQNIHFVGK
jgi:DNA replication protein DnaC